MTSYCKFLLGTMEIDHNFTCLILLIRFYWFILCCHGLGRVEHSSNYLDWSNLNSGKHGDSILKNFYCQKPIGWGNVGGKGDLLRMFGGWIVTSYSMFYFSFPLDCWEN